jgi:hypothetical protein
MRHSRLLLVSVLTAAVALVAAACSTSDSVATPSSNACTITLAPVATVVSAVGASGTLTVTTGAPSCAWTAVSSASYLTASPATGAGSGSISYTMTSNQGAPRSASISVNGVVANFTQDAPQAPGQCAIALSRSTGIANSGGGDVSVDVTGAAACGWKATSNASFLTIKSGASGSGNGTVVITAAQNQGRARSGTVTIGGLTFTVTQDDGITASFQLFDPGQSIGAVTECRFRGATGSTTTCTLTSTSATQGPKAIVSYAWTIQYTYVTVKVLTPTSALPSVAIADQCGQASSTDDGVAQPLGVTLTVTDSGGNTATATSGTGSQPALSVRLFTCGN